MTANRGLALAALLLAAGCHRTPSTAAEAARGIVKVIGTSREHALVLQRATSDSATVQLRAETDESAALERVAGTLIAVRGQFTNRDTLAVSGFRVVAVDGQTVMDGIVRETKTGLVVCPASESCVALGNPPVALRGLIGARIWISGPAATGPNTFGVVEPKARTFQRSSKRARS